MPVTLRYPMVRYRPWDQFVFPPIYRAAPPNPNSIVDLGEAWDELFGDRQQSPEGEEGKPIA